MIDIKQLLKSLITYKASDLHLITGAEPQIRIDGFLKAINLPKLTAKDVESITYSLLTEKQKKIFEESNELDFAVFIQNIGRFRVNYYRSLGNIGAAFRVIPLKVPSLKEIGAPLVYRDLIKREKGLILVTGATGSGKSTTLSAMLNEINENENKHIITVEDPVEFLHINNKSIFSHREIGNDTESFSTAIKYAMRQDPDIILIGEMRDKETIAAALTAAETGHLVFGTLHTNSAPGTINRIIDVFSGDEQPQIRTMLSASLVSVISQSLIPRLDQGRVAASEIMITTDAISNLIREDKIHQIYSQMLLGQNKTNMQTQNQAIMSLLKSGIVSREMALHFSNRQNELKNQIIL